MIKRIPIMSIYPIMRTEIIILQEFYDLRQPRLRFTSLIAIVWQNIIAQLLEK